jgi:hypothetical protein
MPRKYNEYFFFKIPITAIVVHNKNKLSEYGIR